MIVAAMDEQFDSGVDHPQPRLADLRDTRGRSISQVVSLRLNSWRSPAVSVIPG
jgi:hypothetical protein